MKMMYRIRKEGETGAVVVIHPSNSERWGIVGKNLMTWNFGLQSCEAEIRISDQVNDDEILMSGDVLRALMLPVEPVYEIIHKQGSIHVGPLIGIVAGRSLKKLFEKGLRLSRYVKKYEAIGGAILAFTNDGIDRDKKMIFGYLYNPVNKKWVKGIYPYPMAIFKRSSLKKDLHRHFESVIGKRIFNSSTFDKWEMYTWFKNSAELKPFLPQTKIFRNLVDAQQMIEKFGAVYIKPIKGMQGKRVAKVQQEKSGVTIQYIQLDSKEDYTFASLFEAKDFLETHFGGEKFILQQPLNLRFNGSIIDFRVIMVKDQTGSWKNYGVMGRNGVKGQIVSNRHRGGKVEHADVTLARMFTEKPKIQEYKRKMEQVALLAASSIENCGFLFGKLGIDIGIDVDGNVWLIEINHRNPNDFVASFSGDKNLVNVIRYANMMYAKKLAGFI
ncbi:YheC/YheD family protein [Halobacillus halophilus]|uniref:YheC/YheD family endospore coat-associated protein n=1 Tax=Halobacillus halophilus TaxID=1570 RepID=UPI001CD7FA6E|nr:YheC/YheD family protein [Halobacillus halophilus]MCA1011484.1 YheC/YheD family protein [Halobacillus halophilus]